MVFWFFEIHHQVLNFKLSIILGTQFFINSSIIGKLQTVLNNRRTLHKSNKHMKVL